jgi:hypothetical protein
VQYIAQQHLRKANSARVVFEPYDATMARRRRRTGESSKNEEKA